MKRFFIITLLATSFFASLLPMRQQKITEFFRMQDKKQQKKLFEQPYNNTCSICLDSVEQETILPCNHAYHHNCIKEWANSDRQNNRDCPLCRKTFSMDDLTITQLEKIYSFLNTQLPSRCALTMWSLFTLMAYFAKEVPIAAAIYSLMVFTLAMSTINRNGRVADQRGLSLTTLQTYYMMALFGITIYLILPFIERTYCTYANQFPMQRIPYNIFSFIPNQTNPIPR